MGRVRTTVVLVAVTATTFGIGGAAWAKSSADQKVANAAVLTESDVPTGFSGGPFTDDSDDPVLPECKGAMAKADKRVESSPIARSGFQLDSTTGYALIESTVAVLPNVKKAAQAMAAYRDEAAAEACIQARFEEAFDETGVSTSVTIGSFSPEMDAKGGTPVVQGGDEFLGFAGSVRRDAGGVPQLFELQLVLARAGRAVTQLAIVTQGSIPRDDAQAMLQTLVTRMGQA